VALEQLFGRDDRLPLNRKERFYTGTVLPGIICSDSLQAFFRLLGWHDVVGALAPDSTNVQIFSEYDLRDAIRGDPRSPWKHLLVQMDGEPLLSGDTPDLVVLVERPKPLIVAIEAKLFSSDTAKDVVGQIDRQRRYVVDHLKTIVADCQTLQVALVPSSLGARVGALIGDSQACRTLTWEAVLKAYADKPAASYWVALLRYALSREADLRAKGGRTGDQADTRLTAAQILAEHGTLGSRIKYVGAGGRTWPLLQKDIVQTGGTRYRFAVRFRSDPPRGGNYVAVQEFVEVVRSWMRCGVPGQRPPNCVRVRQNEGDVAFIPPHQ
jgi:hypothetical protein